MIVRSLSNDWNKKIRVVVVEARKIIINKENQINRPFSVLREVHNPD